MIDPVQHVEPAVRRRKGQLERSDLLGTAYEFNEDIRWHELHRRYYAPRLQVPQPHRDGDDTGTIALACGEGTTQYLLKLLFGQP